MKKFAIFAGLAVIVSVFWEISQINAEAIKKVANKPAKPDTPTEPTILDSVGVAISDIVYSVVSPVENVVSDIKSSIFGTAYDSIINSSAATYGIPADVLYKLLKQESHFRADIIVGKVKSPTGALGIAQFMPATAVEELGSISAALDPAQAIPGAARYLAKLQKSLGGDLTKAVAAYNWGVGNVKRKGLSRAPTETRQYVSNILGVTLA